MVDVIDERRERVRERTRPAEDFVWPFQRPTCPFQLIATELQKVLQSWPLIPLPLILINFTCKICLVHYNPGSRHGRFVVHFCTTVIRENDRWVLQTNRMVIFRIWRRWLPWSNGFSRWNGDKLSISWLYRIASQSLAVLIIKYDAISYVCKSKYCCVQRERGEIYHMS